MVYVTQKFSVAFTIILRRINPIPRIDTYFLMYFLYFLLKLSNSMGYGSESSMSHSKGHSNNPNKRQIIPIPRIDTYSFNMYSNIVSLTKNYINSRAYKTRKFNITFTGAFKKSYPETNESNSSY